MWKLRNWQHKVNLHKWSHDLDKKIARNLTGQILTVNLRTFLDNVLKNKNKKN